MVVSFVFSVCLAASWTAALAVEMKDDIADVVRLGEGAIGSSCGAGMISTDATGGGETTAGAIPAALAAAMVRSALMYAAGETIGGVVPESALALAERGLKMMSLTRLKAVAFLLMAIGGGAAGVVAVAQSRQAVDQGVARHEAVPEAARRRDDQASKTVAAARIETARSAINMLMDPQFAPDDRASMYRAYDAIPIWSHRLMEDQIRAAVDRAGRVAAMQEHRDRMKKLEDLYSELRKGESRYLWDTDVLNVKYHRLEAEQLLAEAGADVIIADRDAAIAEQ